MRQRLFPVLFLAVSLTLAVQPLTASAAQPSRLLLTTADGEQPTPVTARRTLLCQPPGGDHPRKAAACADLTRANGNFLRLPGDPDNPGCPRDYSPVTVTAKGQWQGQRVSFIRTYGNACVLQATTGPVFEL
ncbi:hypothetical protein JOF53_000587 [Crossiella equi]|uniref:Subtilisin inhibitor domain-containing protein n=1 Tax=Crossiella equi TaxID=130796 RepID=A0ABS5A7N3_9PSEU|nr:subtilase-type protease inhibitor [Crossiella equi]MBP2471715.1 hypothetical protein [Crossiella equi]